MMPGAGGAATIVFYGGLVVAILVLLILRVLFRNFGAWYDNTDSTGRSRTHWAAGIIAGGVALVFGIPAAIGAVDKGAVAGEFNAIRDSSTILQDNDAQLTVSDKFGCAGEAWAALRVDELPLEDVDLLAQETATLEADGWQVTRLESPENSRRQFAFLATRNDRRISFAVGTYRLESDGCDTGLASWQELDAFPAPPGVLTEAEVDEATQQLRLYQFTARSMLDMHTPTRAPQHGVEHRIDTGELCHFVKFIEGSSDQTRNADMFSALSELLDRDGWTTRQSDHDVIAERDGELLSVHVESEILVFAWYPAGCEG